MNENNTVGYIRVSTHEQTEGWSLETQESEIRAYAQQHGLTLIEFYQDESSGGTDERPGFEKMIMDAYAGTFSTILIMNTSRMFRNFILAGIYKNWLRKEMGIDVIFINQPTTHLDEATAFLIERISDLFNEYHLQQLRMWTRAGLRTRAMSGNWNSRLPFGYTTNSKGEAVIDDDTKAGVIIAFQKYATGRFSFEEIALTLNRKGYRTADFKEPRLFTLFSVSEIIKNFFYVGFVRNRGELFAGKHIRIIEPELFAKCQSVREHRAKHSKAYGDNLTTFILAGITSCDQCGQSLRSQSLWIKNKEYRYYRHLHQSEVNICPLQKQGIKAEKLEKLWDLIVSKLIVPKPWLNRIQNYLRDPHQLAQLMSNESSEEIEEKRRRFNLLRNSKLISENEYKKLIKKLQQQEKALNIFVDSDLTVNMELAGHHLQTMSYIWSCADDFQKQLLIRLSLIELSIDLADGGIQKFIPHNAFQALFEGDFVNSETS